MAFIDDCIAEALALETTAFENILAQLTASSFSSTCFECSETKEEVEDYEDKGKDIEPDAEKPSSSKDAVKISNPSTSSDKAE